MARVRKRFILLNEHTSELLLRPETRYFLVASPTAAARDDVDYLIKKLGKLEMAPRALILNSAFVPERNWIHVLETADVTTTAIDEVLSTLTHEREARQRATARITSAFAKRYPNLPQLPLPFVEAVEPSKHRPRACPVSRYSYAARSVVDRPCCDPLGENQIVESDH